MGHLEARYKVERLTPSQSGKTHDENCQYFVLDLTHDQRARDAAWRYAQLVGLADAQLAEEICNLVRDIERGLPRSGRV